eukprot:gnl/MRDRNA2_/MRDRNA2_29055_c0_seq1.p1 gnl/MRDRNA2_/MRDRNA2_29055_c0~~gnl/MRDRNA2_/MRDRNA2_29055_c0_seq1.p1  ORF type:complete len:486 (+),score=155.56 gnl/MRDRNA2_/MRDRNA2_29055_c0_seq1:61-1518(+)
MTILQRLTAQPDARRRSGSKHEIRTKDLEAMLRSWAPAAAHATSMQRAEALKAKHDEQMIRQEMLVDQANLRAEQARAEARLQNDMHTRLAEELKKQADARTKEAADKQRICESSPELRKLRRHLCTAAAAMQQELQLLEQQVKMEEERQYELQMLTALEESRMHEVEKEYSRQAARRAQGSHHKNFLKWQMVERENHHRKEAEDEQVKDRADADAAAAQAYQDDTVALLERRGAQQDLHEILNRLLIYRNEARAAAKQEELKAETRARAEQQQQDQFTAQLARERHQAEESRAKVIEALIQAAEDRHREQQEFSDLRDALLHEEAEAAYRRQEELKLRQKLEQKRAFVRSCEEQLALKQQRYANEREEEERYKRELMEKFAHDDRIELFNQQKRRMLVQQHVREAEKFVQQRRERYEEERKRELGVLAAQREEEQRQAGIIQEERRRLLLEHARPLLRFLPRAALSPAERKELQVGVVSPPRHL